MITKIIERLTAGKNRYFGIGNDADNGICGFGSGIFTDIASYENGEVFRLTHRRELFEAFETAFGNAFYLAVYESHVVILCYVQPVDIAIAHRAGDRQGFDSRSSFRHGGEIIVGFRFWVEAHHGRYAGRNGI